VRSNGAIREVVERGEVKVERTDSDEREQARIATCNALTQYLDELRVW